MDEFRLFVPDQKHNTGPGGNEPLAQKMRPKSLAEIVGQKHLLQEGSALAIAIRDDYPVSAILWGPPGSGKTTLALVIAELTKARFQPISAVSSGVKELKQIIDDADEMRRQSTVRTVVFIDEIHRFNKAQQDVLLPAVESGTITLIGATTENPYFEINAPLLSRMRIFRFEPLSSEEIKMVLMRTITDRDRGLGKRNLKIDEPALDFIADIASGDARAALNILEFAAMIRPDGVISRETAEQAAQQRTLAYDKGGDFHYDVISAFIKSMRGSDPDATVYWLMRMLEAGEDPRFIARRMVVFASEDIGNADVHALAAAVGAAQAVEFVGLPEAEINLAHAALYLACAPKSNAVIRAIKAAKQDLKEQPTFNVPIHLRSTGYRGAHDLGHGEGYIYTHDDPDAFQHFLPEDAGTLKYYEPTTNGFEAEIAYWLNDRREAKDHRP